MAFSPAFKVNSDNASAKTVIVAVNPKSKIRCCGKTIDRISAAVRATSE